MSGTITRAQKADQANAIERLRELLPPGTCVYSILRHVSRSGMLRHIDFYTFDGKDRVYLSSYIATALNERRTEQGALKVPGCGMDMGYHIVHSLGYALYPEGFECIGSEPGQAGIRGRSCPSNDHSNGDRDYTPHHHRSGAYALRHEWL